MYKFFEVTNLLRDQLMALINSQYAEESEVNKLITETSVFPTFITNAATQGYTFTGDPDEMAKRIIETMMCATAKYLGETKTPDPEKATAVLLQDVAGRFKFAGVVQYIKPEIEGEPGSWNYSLLLDEDKYAVIKKQRKVNELLYTSDQFKSVYDKVCHDIGGIKFCSSNYMYDACCIIIDSLVQIMDAEQADTTLEYPGYFTATISIEDGKKYFGIEPDGAMKEVIKSDIVLDAAAAK